MTNVFKKSKRILIILLIINIIFAIVNVSKAFSVSDIIERGDEFVSMGKGEAEYGNKFNTDELQKTISSIFSIIFPLGVAITVIVGGVLGIKFMLASVEDKAKIKEILVPYVVGCVLIFGATGIWKLVVNIGGNIVETGPGIYRGGKQLNETELDWVVAEIQSGKTDINTLTDHQIRQLYIEYNVAQTIKNGFKGDIDKFRKTTDLHYRIHKKTYEVAIARGLLQSNMIDLK